MLLISLKHCKVTFYVRKLNRTGGLLLAMDGLQMMGSIAKIELSKYLAKVAYTKSIKTGVVAGP